MPDCPFEVTTTNRYTINEHEASVTARREIKPREEIKYLTGVQVAMTEEQEKVLELARKDFSLVISSRKKTRSLFLGPARFANHDCDANARLSTKGYDGMQIVAVKPIEIGEEITVSYGEDYFGDDNEECLCQSCEDRLVNGWAPYKAIETDDDDDDKENDDAMTPEPEETPQVADTYPFRRKRKYDSGSTDVSGASTPVSKKVKVEEPEEKSPRLKSPSISPTKRRVSRPLRETTLKKAYSSSTLRRAVPITSIEDLSTPMTAPHISRDFRTQQRVGLLTVTLDEATSSKGTTPASSTVADSPKSFLSTDATSVDEDAAAADTSEKSSLILKPTLGVATIKSSHTRTTVAAALRSPPDDEESESELSELSSDYELDDENLDIVKRKRSKTTPALTPRTTRSRSQYNNNNTSTRISTPIPIDPTASGLTENKRKPGDYIHNDALLSAKYSKWVECHTCDDFFVQQDRFIGTKKECPRCERHSMLYGFVWPKTDKEGKHDREERILDPRTVNRFVDPEEEKEIRKEKKSLRDKIKERYETPRSEVRESSVSTLEPDSGRNRRRVRKTM